MGDGLKRVAKLCGGLTAKDETQEIKYDAKGRKLGPYGCLCQTWHHYMVGDGCEICNLKLAKELNAKKIR